MYHRTLLLVLIDKAFRKVLMVSFPISCQAIKYAQHAFEPFEAVAMTTLYLIVSGTG